MMLDVRVALVGALLALPCALPAPAAPRTPAVQEAREEELEATAQRLLDTPLLARGAWRATFEDTLGLLRAEPDHPLAEAAWALLASRQQVLGDPTFLGRALAGGLPLSTRPLARWRQTRLAGELAVAFASGREELEALGDPFADWLSSALVRGPLPPRTRTLAAGSDPARLREPELRESVPGLFGPVAWQRLERSPTSPYLAPGGALHAEVGHAQLAVPFVVEGGGPALVEIDARFPLAADPRQGEPFPGATARFAWSLDGSEVAVVDLSLEERSPLLHLPVVLRDGMNRLVIETSLEPRALGRFAVRVLGADGLPHPGVRAASDPLAPLGEVVQGTPPAVPGGAVELLDTAPRGPFGEALLGVLLLLDGRPLEGLEHLRVAHERAPEEDSLASILASSTLAAGHLPEAWRRQRARELIELVGERDPAYVTTALLHADVLAGEDREEEALELLDALDEAVPGLAQVHLARAGVLRSLGLVVHAERAIARAAELEPDSARVLAELAAQAERMGQVRVALALEQRAARAGGSRPEDLARLADGLFLAGRIDEALELEREIELRAPRRSGGPARLLADAGRLEEARAELLRRAEERPRDASLRVELADLALLRGQRDEERDWLLEARSIAPWLVPVRERLEELGEADPARELFRAELTDVEQARRAADPDAHSESIVYLLDEAVRHVFDDGSSEQVTQNLYLVKDLAGVEQLGSLELSGVDVLAVATIEPDGRRLEPIEVGGEFVLPGLDPGDQVHVVTRATRPAPGDGIVRPEGWYFASTDAPFAESRYVLSGPERLRWVERGLEGLEREVSAAGEGRELRRYLARGMERVLPEPGMPPRQRVLPNVSVGQDEDELAVVEFLRAEARWYTQVTPEVREAAERATRGAEGPLERARRLYDALRELLDERAVRPLHATHTLLTRAGNASFLYAALLAAADIEADLVWSRDVAPEEDEDPEPDFVRLDRHRQRLLVRVRAEGREVWCDPMIEFLPFGRRMGSAPGAEARVASSGQLVHTPDAPLSERPSVRVRGRLEVAADGSAGVSGRVDLVAGAGYSVKRQVRDLPSSQVRLAVRSLAAQRLPGLEIESFELPGLDTEDEPLALVAEGRMGSFLDREGEGWAARLPLVPLQLSARFADEGDRRLAFRLAEPIVEDVEIELVLEEGLELAEPFEPLVLECPGGRYELRLEGEGRRRTLVRRVAIGAFELPAEEFDGFMAFCRAVDNAERTRLRLR